MIVFRFAINIWEKGLFVIMAFVVVNKKSTLTVDLILDEVLRSYHLGQEEILCFIVLEIVFNVLL